MIEITSINTNPKYSQILFNKGKNTNTKYSQILLNFGTNTNTKFKAVARPDEEGC